MIKINMYMTTSKVLAFLILVIGSVYGFYFHDSSVLIATFAASSGVQALKTYTTSKTDQETIKKENTGGIG